MITGLAVNVAANLVLVPRLGINGAAISSSISYGLTALITLFVFRRLAGRGWLETLVIRRTDVRAAGRAVVKAAGRGPGRPGG